MKYKGF